MNAKTYLLIALSIIAALSCQKEPLVAVDAVCDKVVGNDVIMAETKAAKSTDFFVGESDIASYVYYKQLCNKEKEMQEPEITPLGIDGGVQAYAINYGEGWEIISADKRIRPVLAQASKGSFNLKKTGTSETAFINSVLNSIASLQKEEKDIVTGNETAESHIQFWKLVNCEIDESPRTKAAEPEGYYVLDHVDQGTIIHTHDHMVMTNWIEEYYTAGYDFPLNYWYHPGTGSVAAAQLLAFLYKEKGLSLTTPTSLQGSFMGTIFDWNNIYNDGANALVNYIYQDSNTTYSNQTVWTDRSFLLQTIASFGVNCNVRSNTGAISYFKQTIDNSLGNGEPVLGLIESYIINGSNYNPKQNYFIIDAYKEYQEETIYYYRYVSTNATDRPAYLERVYGSPRYEMYGMRWCSLYCSDDSWYAIDSTLGLYYNLLLDSAVFHNFSN
ncbi:MAG: Spi family protease inhibitor [Bacteroidales bacterium]|nr:Spi family protease inhibitor [Bacteroidales bacterium]